MAKHGTLMLANEAIKVTAREFSDFPSVTWKIWIEREKKTKVNLENGHMDVWFEWKSKVADSALR